MKLKKYLKQKNYLMQLVFTIAGFCCIPLILMQLIMMEQSTRGYSKMNEENIYENLAESTDWFVRQVEKMSNVAMKISQDTVVRKAAKVDCLPYGIYEAHNRIDEYSTDDFTVGVWFDAEDRVLFNQVNITPKRLFEILGEENADCMEMITGITYQPQLLMICVLHKEIKVNDLQERVSEVLKDVTGHDYCTYCGTMVEKITDIRTSYLRSLASASESEADKTEFDSYVAEAIRVFGESLETGDVTAIRKSLEIVELRLSAILRRK